MTEEISDQNPTDTLLLKHGNLSNSEKARLKKGEATALFLRKYPKYESYLRNVPERYRYKYICAFISKAPYRVTLRERLKLKCLECSAWQKEEVRHCTVRACPSWPDRPYQPKEGANENL